MTVRGALIAAAFGLAAMTAVAPPYTRAGMERSFHRTSPRGDKRPSPSEVHSVATDMAPIMTLLNRHDDVRYSIRLIPGGAHTLTTSDDPELTETIRVHAAEMKARMEQGNVLRPRDPIFSELFRRHSEITIRLRDVPGGVAEDETSRNPQVALLIRTHARLVGEFVRVGLARAQRNTPLPRGYHPNR